MSTTIVASIGDAVPKTEDSFHLKAAQPTTLPRHYEYRALEFATTSHQGQFRRGKDRVPYIHHCKGVRDILKDAGISEDAVVSAALLHDTIEECGVSSNLIHGLFGKDIAELVLQLTDEADISRDERHRLQAEKIAWMDERAVLIKMADRIYNLRDYVTETQQMFQDGQAAKVQSYLQFSRNLLKAIIDRPLRCPLYRIHAWNTLIGQLHDAIDKLEYGIKMETTENASMECHYSKSNI